MSQKTPVLRSAAILILARDGERGPEVLMVRRSTQADFFGGYHVFPGGGLSEDDRRFAEVEPVGDDEGSRELLAQKICAIRECFEEAGILLVSDEASDYIAIEGDEAEREAELLRRQLMSGDVRLEDVCRERGWRPATAGMAWFGRWITPVGSRKRFDTQVFVAAAPLRQSPSHDQQETIAHEWMRPEDALERNRQGDIDLVFATRRMLESVSGFASADALLAYAREPRVIQPIVPRLTFNSKGPCAIGPEHGAYAEVGLLDPDGKATVSCEMVPGVPVQIFDRVRRITAPNARYMTGPGTNTYLLGRDGNIAVIDPGPDDVEHVRALMAHAGGAIRWILVTHTHPDHSPAAVELKRLTGAELLGMPPGPASYDDTGFRPDRLLGHGDRLELAGCSLRVVHTPGHAANHLCFLLEEERLLFTGDHIMQGSTVVVDPPSGDMAAYMASLAMLLAEDLRYLAPGHGFLMDQPHGVVKRLLAHRRKREDAVIAALREQGEGTIEQLLPRVYADVPASVHRLASRSLLAHLEKLVGEKRAVSDAGRWWLASGSG